MKEFIKLWLYYIDANTNIKVLILSRGSALTPNFCSHLMAKMTDATPNSRKLK